MGKIFIALCLAWLVWSAATTPVCTARNVQSKSSAKPGFSQRHPKLKKFLLIGGAGAATGGLGAVLMGGSVASGAAVGAGTHVGAHEAVEKYKERKHKPHKEVGRS